MTPSTIKDMLPNTIPDTQTAQIVLIAFRRMAMGGLDDAHAATAMLGHFGLGYRRPLMFLRVLMREVSRTSQQSIHIAPPYCRHMTKGEAAILGLIGEGRSAPEHSRNALAQATGATETLAALSIAQALADALEDVGRPFSR